jgi:hypothetical protein
MQERCVIGTAQIEDPARCRAAEGHPHQRRKHNEPGPGACFTLRKILTNDERIARHNTALKQPEQCGNQIQRLQGCGRQKHQQRKTLQ